jgi:stage II sporulation protein D
VDRADVQTRWGLLAQEYGDKIEKAVTDTDGLGVLYQGEPIQAVFFSSAAGRTVDAVEVWGSAVDYLKGVDSPEGEEVPNYHSQVTLDQETVRQTVLEQYPGADLSGAPETWFTDFQPNSAGGVASLSVGGVTLTGSQVRALFGLRSSQFSLSCQDGNFTFSVTGYGHGVGMSQYGANAMAQAGSDYSDILTWYYTGTEVGELWS